MDRTSWPSTVENQRRELEEVAARHGWQVVAVLAVEGVSGAKGRNERPAFDALLEALPGCAALPRLLLLTAGERGRINTSSLVSGKGR